MFLTRTLTNLQSVFSTTLRLNYSGFYEMRKHQRNPKLRLRTVTPIYPPPGLSLEIPDWPTELFLKRIGGGCSEFADKFESTKEVLELTSDQMKEKAVPAKIRRYILNIKEHLRRGVLTFEYLSRRTAFQVLPKKVSKIRYGDLGRIK